jgi:hypothetical protein
MSNSYIQRIHKGDHVKIVFLFACLVLLSTNSQAASESFVNPELFFKEALVHQQNNNFDIIPSTVEINTLLNDFSSEEQLLFKNLADSESVKTNENYAVINLRFQNSKKQIFSCLGTILQFPFKEGSTDVIPFLDRSGVVLYSSCKIKDNEQTKTLEGEYKYYLVFPLDTSLPISSSDIAQEYSVYTEIAQSELALNCQDQETNLFGEPRSAAKIFETADHFIVNMMTTSSASTSSPIPDLPVNLGFIDKGSLDWVSENIDFLLNMKGATMVAFAKSECMTYALKSDMPTMFCGARVEKSDRHYNIAQVYFSWTTEKSQTTGSIFDYYDNHILPPLVTTYKHELELTMVLYPENNEIPKVYKMVLDYQNKQDTTKECMTPKKSLGLSK